MKPAGNGDEKSKERKLRSFLSLDFSSPFPAGFMSSSPLVWWASCLGKKLELLLEDCNHSFSLETPAPGLLVEPLRGKVSPRMQVDSNGFRGGEGP